jgi:aminopeptidase
MGETLYDENVGGTQGNTHIAIGSAYVETYRGDFANMTPDELEALGFNQSAEHIDIVSTAPRTVTATLTDGSELVIYKDGQFTV